MMTRTRTHHPLIGKVVRWTHGPNVLEGPATHYDDEDDELFIVPDGVIHGHYWVPAKDCVEATSLSRTDAAEDGLFRVVQALGFDMDGAKNASEFFGPMTYCTEDAWLTEPADIAVAYAVDHRKEMEEEADKYETEIAWLTKRADKAWEVINSDYWRNRYDEDMARGNAYVASLRDRLRATLRALKDERTKDGA